MKVDISRVDLSGGTVEASKQIAENSEHLPKAMVFAELMTKLL